MKQYMHQEILLPTCGIGATTSAQGIQEFRTCIDVVAPPNAAPGDTVNVIATLRKVRAVGILPIANKILHYRVMRGLQVVEGPLEIGPTDVNGKVTLSFTIPSFGVYRFQFVFVGEDANGDPMVSVDQAFALCPAQGVIGCSGPGGIGGPGGIIRDRILTQSPCELGCGCSLSQDLHGLEPE